MTGRSYFARAGFFLFGNGAGFPGAIRFSVRSNASGDSSAPSSRAICLKRRCCSGPPDDFFFAAMLGV